MCNKYYNCQYKFKIYGIECFYRGAVKTATIGKCITFYWQHIFLDVFFLIGEVVFIKALEEKILKEGQVFPGNVLNVGSFLNQQIDTAFLDEMADEIVRLYGRDGVNKILTVEASGIAIATAAALKMKVPVVFAKKGDSKNMSEDRICAEVKSFTKGTVNIISVDRRYIKTGDRLLIIDDFLADGNALRGLLSIAKAGGAETVGACTAIEKGFQGGGDALRSEGIRVESLAIIEGMTDKSITFRVQNNVM